MSPEKAHSTPSRITKPNQSIAMCANENGILCCGSWRLCCTLGSGYIREEGICGAALISYTKFKQKNLDGNMASVTWKRRIKA